MYSQYCVLNNFRFRNFGQIFGAIRHNIRQTFRHNSAQYCRIVPNIRHNSALFGTFRHFSAFFGNNFGEHPFSGQPNSLTCAPGFLDCHRIANCINKSHTPNFINALPRIVPNSAEYWALFGTFRHNSATFRHISANQIFCVCVLLVDDS